MSDKEPRRRKKRKDSQRKDDVRSDDQLFGATKSESRDSDQEAEEEIVVPSHHPSGFAKLVFVLLFSCLVVSMSFIFISLQGAERGPVDIFNTSHAEEHETSHDIHDEAELWTSSEASEEHLEDFLPGIESILSFNDEIVKDPQTVRIEETHYDQEEKTEEISHEDSEIEVPVDSSNAQLEDSLVDQESIQEYQEDADAFSEDPAPPETHTESIFHDSFAEDEQEMEIPPQIPMDDSKSSTIPPFTTSEAPDLVSEAREDSTPVSNIEVAFEEELQSPIEEELRSPIEEELQSPVEENVLFDMDSENSKEEERFPVYEKADITNEADYLIREKLDEMERVIEKSPEKTMKKCEDLLLLNGESPRLNFIKAQALDKLAEIQRSNKYLEDSIAAYQKVMSLKEVPEKLYLSAGKRAADRMRFRGFMGKSVKLLSEMMNKFPENIDIKNQVAVGYLLIGQNKEAKKLLYEILSLDPDSGFAKVHLGFILKTDESNYAESIKLMREGIASREPGVIDGRFYFHLGDALHRTGKQDEAMKVYEDAVKEGLFFSAYQRSLYNVKGLTAKPWWSPVSTPHAPDFQILEKNWMQIRDEALSLINEKNTGFLPETEGLQDKGDWKQLELFARGRKIDKNCELAPKTCSIISQIPDAASCKRGQVKFSLMHPSTHVWAHTGPTNCRLRAHLGLVVPDGVSIRVANETRQWEEGKVILFDDSFEHEVWHNGSTYRLVLIVDFWHPELTAYQKRSLTPI